ncbi:MAG: hypothetical protein QXK47_01010 [Candidatus Bathyarchaeia archaeon]
MFGFYENFPVNVQKVMRFASTVSSKTLQKVLVQCLAKLNSENLRLQDIISPSTFECTVAFEFGIADGDAFNYLDQDETQKVLGEIHKAPLQIMDLFCAIRYYKERDGNKSPLKFDYYMIRLIFSAGYVDTLIFHERGPRHMPPEDLINLIVERVNQLFPRRVLKAV